MTDPRGERFVAHLRAELAPPLSAWISPATLERGLERRISTAFGACTDEARAERLALACPVAGATAEDYLAREVVLSSGGRALVGIRFKGRDPQLPFVDLLATDHDLGTAWDELAARAAAAFSALRPRWLRVVVAAGRPRSTDARPDLHVVAGPLSDAASPLPPGVSLERRHDLDFLSAYEALYEPFVADEGPRARRPPPISREAFARCLTEGAIVCVRAGDAWAGVAAASPGSVWIVDGHEVTEEWLVRDLRGRGVGTALQRALMAALASKGKDGGELLVGTIHARNAPSLATARRCGREVVATFWFVDL